jgi:hypothetical protein
MRGILVYDHPRSPVEPLHTQDRVPATIGLQALSSVEKAELIQVRFTLRLRDQRSIYVNARWM